MHTEKEVGELIKKAWKDIPKSKMTIATGKFGYVNYINAIRAEFGGEPLTEEEISKIEDKMYIL